MRGSFYKKLQQQRKDKMLLATQPRLTKDRPRAATFDEILFADDTICAKTSCGEMTKLLQEIEKIGQGHPNIIW